MRVLLVLGHLKPNHLDHKKNLYIFFIQWCLKSLAIHWDAIYNFTNLMIKGIFWGFFLEKMKRPSLKADSSYSFSSRPPEWSDFLERLIWYSEPLNNLRARVAILCAVDNLSVTFDSFKTLLIVHWWLGSLTNTINSKLTPILYVIHFIYCILLS